MRWKSLKVNDVSVGENYINLGDIQASAGIKAEGSANQSGQPSSGPPEPPKASAPPPPPPPPPPPNNANAEFEAGSPPEKSQPIVINNVKAPLKVYNDIDFDQDVQPIDKKKEVEKKTSEAEMSTDGKKKKKNEEEQTGKTTQYYLARASYGIFFILFFVMVIFWTLATFTALHWFDMEFMENMIMNAG